MDVDKGTVTLYIYNTLYVDFSWRKTIKDQQLRIYRKN